MSDFLTRLARRAIGGAGGSGLEPVREPVFPADATTANAPDGESVD
jgi:hypothetical protein